MQSYYLQKADENLPELRKTVITPCVGERVLGSGDTLVIDLGNHYVGYFSFKLWFVDVYIDAPVRMAVRFCETARELEDDYDDYNKKLQFTFKTEEILPIKTVDDYGNETEITPVVEKRFVTAGGILHEVRIVKGKDNKLMAFGVIEDPYGSVEVGVYGDHYEKYKTIFVEDAFVVVKGNLSESRDGYKIGVREVINPKNIVVANIHF